ncbi:uncharacterized protein V6R79_024960 [Siganus canaliculatus]
MRRKMRRVMEEEVEIQSFQFRYGCRLELASTSSSTDTPGASAASSLNLSASCLSENPDDARRGLDQTIIGIYVIQHPGASVDQLPEDVGIIVEGVQNCAAEARSVCMDHNMMLTLFIDINGTKRQCC